MMGALAARNNLRVKNARQPVNSTIKQQHKNTQTAVRQGFPALRKAVTTHVKKYRIFLRVSI